MANLTVVVPDGAVPRVKTALRAHLGLDHDPVNTEILAYLRSHLRDIVVRYETQVRQNQVPVQANAAVEADFPGP